MATEASLNYFTCTLGEAAELMGNIPRDFETITEFIDVQAQIHRDKPAVGFPFPASENNETRGYNLYCKFAVHEKWNGQVLMLTS
jgi:hypothetical protein